MHKIYHSSEGKSCCCVVLFFRFLHFELISNNQIYLLCCFPTLLIPRSLRLSFFFLGILLEICLNALFHNLEEESDSNEGLFVYESMVENFWVGLYSVLISLVIMSILSLGLSLGVGKQKRQLVQASRSNELASSYSKLHCSLWSRCCVGLTIFTLLSCFLSLYLIGFYQIASEQAEQEFIESTLSAIIIDLVIFEVIPGFLVATVGLLVFGCRVKCCNLILVIILSYRAVRNFVGF